jgi:hypothetical protein
MLTDDSLFLVQKKALTCCFRTRYGLTLAPLQFFFSEHHLKIVRPPLQKHQGLEVPARTQQKALIPLFFPENILAALERL